MKHQLPAQQPAHAEHIHRGSQRAIAEPVLAHAELPGPVIDGHLDQGKPGALDQRGDKAVHPGEWHEGGHALPPHGFERATRIADAVPREPAAHEIRDAAGKPLDQRILALRAVPAGEIRTALDFGDEPQDIRGVVLQIAVDERDDPPARGMQPCIHRGALPRIARKPEHAHPAALQVDARAGAVARAVVDKHHLVVDTCERRRQFPLQDGDVFLLVIEWYDDREIR